MDATSKRCREATFERSGRGGQFGEVRRFGGFAIFLLPAQPPLLFKEGNGLRFNHVMSTIILILALVQSIQDVTTSANADFKAGRWADAAAKYETVLKENGSDLPSRFKLAVCYSRLGNVEAAIAAYQTLLTQDAAIYEARVNLGILLAQHGRRKEASEQFERAVPLLVEAVKSEPSNADYLYLLGKSYEQLKAFPQAITALEQAIRIKADHVEAYETLATVFYSQKNWARAAQVLSRVIELQPRDALPHFGLATCLDNLGNAKEAIVQYNQFLEFDDGSNDARSFQARQRAKTLERRLKR